MKMKNIQMILVAFVVLFFAGCGGVNKEIKQDAKNIADAMCKNIDAMNKLRAADSGDSVLVQELQMQAKQVQIEMTILYQEFKAKYKEQTKEEKFNKEFSKELRKAMLDCKSLSPKEREQFEKEME